ncbi:Na-translocating system protein MpsC family protein [Patulibacter sp. SYSU D01012]|uniref:Na-translocating system protein MpsC family protein n=1 Tax=Patulibacter sp. SYSU D01012 TaxID=2817381 RepID=UPI001B316C5F
MDESVEITGDAPERREPSATARIANAVASAYKTHYGKGPESLKVHYTGDAVFVLLRGGFSVVEGSLWAKGQGTAVRDQRRAFGDMIAPLLSEAVGEVVDRGVVAVLSDTSQDPDLTGIILVLSDAPADPA